MVLGFGFSSFDARQDGGHSRRHDHGDLSAASVRHASTQYYCSHGSSWFPEIVSTTSPASYFEMVFDQATVLESRVFKPATRVWPSGHMHSGTSMNWNDGGIRWLHTLTGFVISMVFWITARTTLWGECGCLQRSHQRLRKVQALGKCCGSFLRVARASRMKNLHELKGIKLNTTLTWTPGTPSKHTSKWWSHLT